MTVTRRSDATRAAILKAARERFAADGYERATIRAIATDAAIDPSMVMRYFGSKERLFAAAAAFELRLPDLASMPRDEVGARLIGHFYDRWEGDESLLVLLRTGVSNENVAARMRDIFAAQLGPMAMALCDDPAEAAERAALTSTQVLGFALCRYILKLPPIVTMDRATIVRRLGPVLQGYLVG